MIVTVEFTVNHLEDVFILLNSNHEKFIILNLVIVFKCVYDCS